MIRNKFQNFLNEQVQQNVATVEVDKTQSSFLDQTKLLNI